jgi:serine/threonine-protein kinase
VAGIKSIAVLPFEDLSPGKDQETWAAGIPETLINALSRIEGLHVSARTSSFFFKGKPQDIREIGQKLGVENLLEGSIQIAGNKLRLMVRLINIANGFPVWSEDYNKTVDDVFAIQDDIAQSIVKALKIELLGEKQEAILKSYTTNLEAYNLYLQGVYLWNKRGKENLLKSIEYFEKAIQRDPNYALGYAGMANAYWILGNNGLLPPHEAYPIAKAYAIKALKLDENLTEARAALAGVKRDFEWDFRGAVEEYRKAIIANPGNASAHHGYSFLLSYMGRHDEAIQEVKLARDLDPLAPRIKANVGHILFFARKYGEALEELKKSLEFDPNHAATYEYFGDVYREMGRYEEAAASLIKAKGIGDNPKFNIKLALSYARAGNREESKKILGELKERARKEFVSPAILATVYGALGEKKIAFELLDKAYSERDNILCYLKVDPIYDPLRSDPRFSALLRKIGL